MFKPGDKVKSIIHAEGFKRIDLKGEVIEVSETHKNMEGPFIKVRFKHNHLWQVGVFFASAFEMDNEV